MYLKKNFYSINRNKPATTCEINSAEFLLSGSQLAMPILTSGSPLDDF